MRTIARTLVAAAAACAVVAPAAGANAEITDGCGPGAIGSWGGLSPHPEPVFSWLDVCRVDMSGVSGAGPLRAVRSVLHLYGEVPSGAGGAYDVRFVTEDCFVTQEYRIYSGPQDAETALYGNCGYRTEPCEWPESELPRFSCGTYESEFDLRDSDAVSVTVEGKLVAVTFDPNRLPAESLPDALARDLAPDATSPEVRYGSLARVWIQTLLHQGVRGAMSNAVGPGGDYARATGPVPLD